MNSLSRKFVAAGFAGVFGASVFSNCAVGAANPQMKCDNPPTGEKKCAIRIPKFGLAIWLIFVACCAVFKFVILPKLQASGTQTEDQKKDENNNPDESDFPDKGDPQTKEDNNQEQFDSQKGGMSRGTKALIGGSVALGGTAAVGTGIAVAIKSKKGDVDVGKTEDSGPYMFLRNSNATSVANTGPSEEAKQDLGATTESNLEPENKGVPLDAFRGNFSVESRLGKGEAAKDKEPEKIDE